MKNTIYIVILVLTLSCNKKVENEEINVSKLEHIKSLEDTLSKTSGNLDSISKKELEASSDTTSVIINGTLEINKQLNGVWYAIEIEPNKPDNIVGFVYMFDAEKEILEAYDTNDLRGQYNYKIVNNCEENEKKSDSYSLKLSGDGSYCSKILSIKHKNNKTYLILKDFITDDFHKEFLKISDDPKFFPEGFK